MSDDFGELKQQGNVQFKSEQYLKAAGLYTRAIKCAPEDLDSHALAVLYSNRSAALLKLDKVEKALKDAEKCLELDPQWHKALFRKAQALEAKDQLPEALSIYQQAAQLSQNNRDIEERISEITRTLRKQKQQAEQQQRKAAQEASVGSSKT